MSTFVQTTYSQPILSARNAQKQAELVIRAHSKTFFFATAFLPRAPRQGIRALYGFCRATDDLVDTAEPGCAGLVEVENWRKEVALPPELQSDPILFTWARVRQDYPIDRQFEQELIDGVAQDIQFQPYATWADLEHYCYQVAATVGLLSMPIIRLAKNTSFTQAAPYAIRLGIALQLTNILRDVGEDARRGRVYFPQEDLRRFGLTHQDILNGVFNENFVALMHFEIARARELYRQALPGIRLLHPSARVAVGSAALLYRAILDEIERIGCQVHTRRAYTSGWKKLRMLPEIFLTTWRLKTP
jgi:15-cis-phytoene synthase